jgi:hypothetical protein
MAGGICSRVDVNSRTFEKHYQWFFYRNKTKKAIIIKKKSSEPGVFFSGQPAKPKQKKMKIYKLLIETIKSIWFVVSCFKKHKMLQNSFFFLAKWLFAYFYMLLCSLPNV